MSGTDLPIHMDADIIRAKGQCWLFRMSQTGMKMQLERATDL